MALDSFIKKYNGKGIDYDGSYGNQCVDLFRQYVKEVLDQAQPKGVVGAKDFWTNYETDPALRDNFKKIPNTPTGVPKKGDVIIWGAKYGKFGHIAVVTHADVNTFTAFSQNDPVGTLCQKRKYANYKGVLGWFEPNMNEEPTPPAKFDVEADLSSEVEADAGLKGYRWYNNKWSFVGLVEFTDFLDRENERLKVELVEAQNHKPTLQEAIKVLLSYIGVK